MWPANFWAFGRPPHSSSKALQPLHSSLITIRMSDWLIWLLIFEIVCSWKVLLQSEKMTCYTQHFYDFEGSEGTEKWLKKKLRLVSNLTLLSPLEIGSCVWGGDVSGGYGPPAIGGGEIRSSSMVSSTACHFLLSFSSWSSLIKFLFNKQDNSFSFSG